VGGASASGKIMPHHTPPSIDTRFMIDAETLIGHH
jgi:hypothetical protein